MNSFGFNAVCNSAGHSLQFSLIKFLVIGNYYCSKLIIRRKVIMQSGKLNYGKDWTFWEGQGVPAPVFFSSLGCTDTQDWGQNALPDFTCCNGRPGQAAPARWNFQRPPKGGPVPIWSTLLVCCLSLHFHRKDRSLCIGGAVSIWASWFTEESQISYRIWSGGPRLMSLTDKEIKACRSEAAWFLRSLGAGWEQNPAEFSRELTSP